MITNEHITKKRTIVIFSLLSFLIPISVMIVAGAIIGIEPFGSNSFLVSDTANQFAMFYTYFKHEILSGDNLLYSLSKTIGGDMSGFNGYYLQNPFALMLLFFSDEKMAVGIYWMETLQLGFMGLSCFTFMRLRPSCKDNLTSHLMCALAYSMMGYAISYMTLSIYYCNLILLPLIMLGLERMLKDRHQFVLYVSMLALAIWCNYYLGYMTCIFCGLYCIKELVINEDELNLKDNMLLFGRFALETILAVLMSSFSLIPVVLSLSGEKNAPMGSVLEPRILYGIKSLIRNMLPGTFTCGFTILSAPYIYVGILSIIGYISYLFMGKNINIKRRLIDTALAVLLILSTMISTTDVIWHAFNEPVGFAHRQAFVICLYLLILADNGLCMILPKVKKKYVYIALVIIQIMDLGFNTVSSMKAYANLAMADQNEYALYINEMGDIINHIKKSDNSLYRIEKDVAYNMNDALLFDYAGLTHNSSCEKDYVREFMGRIGFRNQGIWSHYYQGNTSFVDSLLGVKYFISRFDSTNKPYAGNYNNNKYFSFENPYVLPLGFTADLDSEKERLNSQNLFANQNKIAVATGGVSDIYTPAEVNVVLNGLIESTEETFGRNDKSGLNLSAPNECVLYTKTGETEVASIDYYVSIDEACNLYCYFSAPNEQGCKMYINDFLRDSYFDDYRWSITNLGNFVAGDTVKITLELTEDALRIYEPFFYKENINALGAWYQNATADKVSLSRIDSSHYCGKVNSSKEQLLVFSVPFEKGMRVYIDDEKSETFRIWDALLAVRISEGAHNLELKYFPDGMSLGITLSILALICLASRVIIAKNYKESYKEA